MTVSLDTIIFFVRDVDRLKNFYTRFFDFEVLEEIPAEWVLLKAGQAKLGLHKMGNQYLDSPKAELQSESNCKIVFTINEDIVTFRAKLLSQNVAMREIKTFDNTDYWLCDAEDPEGNVFQLRQMKI